MDVHPTHPMASRTMDRRTFLRRTMIGGAALGFAGVGLERLVRRNQLPRPWDASAFAPPGTARVAVVRASSYDGDLEGQVRDGLGLIGADVRGARVLLKPNFVEYDPWTAINTDPRLVAAVALAVRRMGAASVTVGEGPGHRRDTQYVITRSGLVDALGAVDTPFVDLNADLVVPVRLRSAYTPLRALWLPRAVVDADVVISMPKMKTHHWAD